MYLELHLYWLTAERAWHERVDDWVFILDAGEGGKLLVWEPHCEKTKAEIVPTEVEIVYIVGGSREPVDVCHYPKEGKRVDIEVNMTTGKWKGEARDGDRLAMSD
ncbi:hypothetical protein C8Q80DRAFT_1275556 [Daedaleopsis nitida]|nr:hypothetical protein C8Q80DRAFT_1275556 [Daedaleopsis nitida]